MPKKQIGLLAAIILLTLATFAVSAFPSIEKHWVPLTDIMLPGEIMLVTQLSWLLIVTGILQCILACFGELRMHTAALVSSFAMALVSLRIPWTATFGGLTDMANFGGLGHYEYYLTPLGHIATVLPWVIVALQFVLRAQLKKQSKAAETNTLQQ